MNRYITVENSATVAIGQVPNLSKDYFPDNETSIFISYPVKNGIWELRFAKEHCSIHGWNGRAAFWNLWRTTTTTITRLVTHTNAIATNSVKQLGKSSLLCCRQIHSHDSNRRVEFETNNTTRHQPVLEENIWWYSCFFLTTSIFSLHVTLWCGASLSRFSLLWAFLCPSVSW